MKQKNNNQDKQQEAEIIKDTPVDNLTYPASEDIYSKSKKEVYSDTEDPLAETMINENSGTVVNKDDGDVFILPTLDVPGAELDDEMEKIGSGDEENNYYSLGQDNHNDLEDNLE
jgi:hypothetical protein